MHPYLYDVGSSQLPSYGVLVALAFVVAFLMVHGRAAEAGVDADRLPPVYLAAGLGGLLGARALYLVAVNPAGLLDPSAWVASGGMAYYGGVIGGFAALVVVAVITKIPLLPLFDLAAPALVVALGIGRMGCFFAGCCHGAVAPIGPDPSMVLGGGFLDGEVWWSGVFPFITTEFHAGVGRLHDVPLYPTQLWSALAGLSVGSLLAWAWSHRRFDGQIAASMLMIEPVFRIAIESFRADHRGVAVPLPDAVVGWLPGLSRASSAVDGSGGLTTSQTIGLLMMLAGAGLWFGAKRLASAKAALAAK
jgi:phosphatidylglycerol:prolipoprotein diacylglycerol transferase